MSNTKFKNPRSLLFFVDDNDSSFALEVTQYGPADPQDDQDWWSIGFIHRGPNRNHKLQPWNVSTIHGRCRYETYQEALMAGYEISELFGYDKFFPRALVWGWVDDDLEVIAEIEIEQVQRWYEGTECPFCGEETIDYEHIDEIIEEKDSLPEILIH